MTTTNTSSNFIDLHTTGIGYLSRVSEITPNGRKRDSFTRCTINAMHGEKEDLHLEPACIRKARKKGKEFAVV